MELGAVVMPIAIGVRMDGRAPSARWDLEEGELGWEGLGPTERMSAVRYNKKEKKGKKEDSV